jgi:hypothetical protein
MHNTDATELQYDQDEAVILGWLLDMCCVLSGIVNPVWYSVHMGDLEWRRTRATRQIRRSRLATESSELATCP